MKYTFLNRYQRLGGKKIQFVPYTEQTPLPLNWSIVTGVEGHDRYSLRKSYETNKSWGKLLNSYIQQQDLFRITNLMHNSFVL